MSEMREPSELREESKGLGMDARPGSSELRPLEVSGGNQEPAQPPPATGQTQLQEEGPVEEEGPQ